jgi:hypothetical protein
LSEIIAGTFEQAAQAEAARAKLEAEGISPDQVCIMFVNPAGQHGEFPIGGDEHKSLGAKDADAGAGKGAALGGAVGVGVGLLATPFIGPAGVVAGVSAASLVGAVAGGVSHMGEKPQGESDHDTQAKGEGAPAIAVGEGQPKLASARSRRPTGMMLAVNSVDRSCRELALRVLREAGALGIEQAQGRWEGGRWVDFEPTQPLQQPETPSH